MYNKVLARVAGVSTAAAIGLGLASKAFAGDTFTSVQASADTLLGDTNAFVLHMIWLVFGYVVVFAAIGLIIYLVYALLQKAKHGIGGGGK